MVLEAVYEQDFLPCSYGFRPAIQINRHHGPRAPLPRLGGQNPTWRKAAALAREWQLSRLADRLEKLG